MQRIATPFTLHFVFRRLYDAGAAPCTFRDTGGNFHRGGCGGRTKTQSLGNNVKRNPRFPLTKDARARVMRRLKPD